MNDTVSPTKPRRFLIVGLPRSGTTYLMTLLNTHPDVLCAGEQFNPYTIIDVDTQTRAYSDLLARDQKPRMHSEKFFEAHDDSGHACVGYKFMIGHNVRLLRQLSDLTDYSLIYVHRENKLAQIASLIKADETKRWAQNESDGHIKKKISVGPLKINQYWHEFATQDFLFTQWFRTLPQKKWRLEYKEMFQDGFEKQLCEFMNIRFDRNMQSPLVKQGVNNILDRFAKPGPIQHYFKKIGREDWLGPEI
jgi:LPS sulfotransferase NodH